MRSTGYLGQGNARGVVWTYIVRLRVAVLAAQIGVVGVSCAVAVFDPCES